MPFLSEKFDLDRIARVPQRIRQDWRTVRLLRNWRETLTAKLQRRKLQSLQFRDNVILHSPNEVDLGFLFHEIWLDGVYNRKGYEVRPGDVVIDIGANIGTFAIYAATRAEGVKVYAYEPFPENFTYLRRNLSDSRLNNIIVHQCAVAGGHEQRMLQVANAWILNSLAEKDAALAGKGAVSVDCVTLAEIVEEAERCDLLKIDCEGSEYEIFYSTPDETLGRIKRIVGEYHEGSGAPAKTGKALCEYLRARSFRIDHLEILDESTGAFFATNTSIS